MKKAWLILKISELICIILSISCILIYLTKYTLEHDTYINMIGIIIAEGLLLSACIFNIITTFIPIKNTITTEEV